MASLRIWELVSQGKPLTPYIEEFTAWVEHEREALLKAHDDTVAEVQRVYALGRAAAAARVGVHDMSVARSLGAGREFREAFAELASQHPSISAMLMTLLDGGDIDRLVWKKLRPHPTE